MGCSVLQRNGGEGDGGHDLEVLIQGGVQSGEEEFLWKMGCRARRGATAK